MRDGERKENQRLLESISLTLSTMACTLSALNVSQKIFYQNFSSGRNNQQSISSPNYENAKDVPSSLMMGSTTALAATTDTPYESGEIRFLPDIYVPKRN